MTWLTSVHHTGSSSKEDRVKKIITQLAESKVFDYIPGHFHHTFKGIKPHVSSHIDVALYTETSITISDFDFMHNNYSVCGIAVQVHLDLIVLSVSCMCIHMVFNC